MTEGPTRPVEPQLRPRERRVVWLAGVVPVLVAAATLTVLASVGRGTLTDVVVGTVVYGGILGITAAVLSYERTTSAHCPRCDATGPVRRDACEACGYDLAERPLHRCASRHPAYLEDGLCECGQRLSPVVRERGLGRELTRILWAGVWVAALLLGVWMWLRHLA